MTYQNQVQRKSYI